ncbi:MAG: ImmA/IrrE family metallo-endopeptidase [Rhodobacteraceae bacterium]|nr:ImmA/IrrE family metallo-endopeptidase [Paracoccaceae bacterium]MCY4250667.1 ImmA/IrrE family metallo-endopeptidase [Paracoccaceae bacterium]
MIFFVDQWKVVKEARSNVPVDVEGIPEKLGIKYEMADLDRNLSGMLLHTNGTFRIIVSANDPISRRRFTLTHEIGHYMLHRKLIGDGLHDNRIYRSEKGSRFYNKKIKARHETEANKFAAYLLMPREKIHNEWNHRNKDQKKIPEMAELFGVSKQAMAIRLGVTYEK